MSLFGHADRGDLVRFASDALGNPICVDPVTGEVVEVINTSRAPTLFVNSSLPQFTRTVKAVIEGFPYYGEEASVEEIDAAARSLEGIVRGIDPAAFIPDRYWSTFVDDVEMGDFSTEDGLAVDG